MVDPEVLLNSPHPIEYFLEHLPVSWTSLLKVRGGFKIAGKLVVRERDARNARTIAEVSALGQVSYEPAILARSSA